MLFVLFFFPHACYFFPIPKWCLQLISVGIWFTHFSIACSSLKNKWYMNTTQTSCNDDPVEFCINIKENVFINQSKMQFHRIRTSKKLFSGCIWQTARDIVKVNGVEVGGILILHLFFPLVNFCRPNNKVITEPKICHECFPKS